MHFCFLLRSVCLCACMYVCACINMNVKTNFTITCHFSDAAHLIFLKQGSLVGQLVCEQRDSFHFFLPSTEIISNTPAFLKDSGNWPQVLFPLTQALYWLRHLPNPCFASHWFVFIFPPVLPSRTLRTGRFHSHAMQEEVNNLKP